MATLEPPAEPAAGGPVFYLDGGPGGDGVTLAELLSETRVAQERPVVIVGQRGTPFAEPSLDCTELEAVDEDQLDQDLGTAATDAAAVDAVRACNQRVGESVAFETYDSVTAADDLEAARVALGYDEWNLLGVSYGTRLALEVLRRHPDALRSIVIDSAYPAEVDGISGLLPGAERAFEALAASCDEDPACAAAYPDLLERVAALYSQLEAEPVDVTVPHPRTGEPTAVRWDGDRTVEAAFLALYATELIPALPSLLTAFERGEFAPATGIYLELVEGSAAAIAEGLYLAVECRERFPFTDIDEVARQEAEEPAWLVAASGASSEIEACEAWDAPPADEEVIEPVAGDVPMLVLAGELDPITPPEWGRQVAGAQESAYFYEFPGYGHGVFVEVCAEDLVATFYDDPGTEPDAACIDDIGPPEWVVPG